MSALPSLPAFGSPWWLLLLIVPALYLLSRPALLSPGLVLGAPGARVAMPRTWRTRLRSLPELLRTATLTCLVLALTNPQLTSPGAPTYEPVELMLVLDMSSAMGAVDLSLGELREWQARHGADPPNRLARVRSALLSMLDEAAGDRIGVVVFGREAWSLFPPTDDHAALRALIEDLELGIIDPEGSAMGNGLGLALRPLLSSTARLRGVVVLSDGIVRGDNLSLAELATLATTEGIPIHTLYVGRQGEALVPQQAPRPDVRTPHTLRHFDASPATLTMLADRSGGLAGDGHTEAAVREHLRDVLRHFPRSSVAAGAPPDERPFRAALIASALLLLLVELLLRATLLRRLP